MFSSIQSHISYLRNKVLENFQKSFVALTVVAVILGGFFVAGSALAETWTVGSSETDNFATIQEAINEAETGDSIQVAAGKYNERIVIDKPLTLRGATYDVDKNGYDVPADYAWDESVESIINNPEPALSTSQVVDIVSDDVVFEGFIVQSLNALPSSANDHLLRLDATTGTANDGDVEDDTLDNIVIRNNVIGPNTNLTSQNGTNGRMGLYFASPNYSSDERGITNTLVTGNKIIDSQGNGNNVFVWGAAESYSSPSNADYTNTVIEYNEISGSHRSGIEISGGVDGLIIRNNSIHSNSGFAGDDPNNLKYGNGILIIRMGSDKTSVTAMGSVNIVIEDNQIYDNEKNGIYLGPINSGHNISGNAIYGNGWDAIRVDLDEAYHSGSAPVYDRISDISAENNEIYDNNIGAQVVGTPTNDFVLDATNNWWGSAVKAIIQSGISTSVSFEPYYVNSEKTILSDAVTDIVYVDDDYADGLENDSHIFGYDAFVTIQEGIIAVVENGTVNVATGTYEEAVTINKPLTIKGAGSEETVIDAGAVLPVINIDSSNVTLEGLKVANGNWGVGVRNASDIENINFEDVVVDGSTASGFVFDGSGKVSNITFIDCRADNNGNRGIYFAPQTPSENVVLTNTSADNNQIMGFNNQGIMTNLAIKGGTFNGNVGGIPKDTTEGPYYGFGISVENTTGVDIQQVTAENNGTEGPAEGGAGIVIKGSSSGVNISDVILTGNKIGLWLEPKWGNNPVPEDTTITNSKIFDNIDYEVKNDIEEITVDAAKSWWGTFSSAEIAAKISNNVSYEPYCAVADCSLIYNKVVAADSPLAGTNMAIPTSTGATATSTPSVTFLSTATITVTNDGGESVVTIPEGVVITRADGENLDTTLLSSSSVDSASLAGLGTGVVAEGALQWGIENIGLEFDPPITISIFVGTDLNGQTLDIVRSTSGSDNWTNEGILQASCVVSDGLCTFETTKASYFAATSITPPPAPVSRRRGGTSSEIVFSEEETVVQEAEETVIPEAVEELPESAVEEEIPSAPFTEAEELLTPEEEPLSEETIPSEETAPRREALVFPPVEVIPEQGLASLLLATMGAIRESAWMSITVILCLLGLAVIGIREWKFTRKIKRQ
jgi:hypothetical protein